MPSLFWPWPAMAGGVAAVPTVWSQAATAMTLSTAAMGTIKILAVRAAHALQPWMQMCCAVAAVVVELVGMVMGV